MKDITECSHFLDNLENLGADSFLNETIREIVRKKRTIIEKETYISSWCEYNEEDPDEDTGMWEIYGSQNRGVALVVDSSNLQPSKLTARKIKFGVYTSKIEYVSAKNVGSVANDIIDKIDQLEPELLSENRILTAAAMLLSKAPTFKSAFYKGEKEMRFLLNPRLSSLPFGSGVLVNGGSNAEPRRYFALSLKNYGEVGLDLRISSLLKK